jgi:hypothetical protein
MAYKLDELNRCDRIGMVLTIELLQFYYSDSMRPKTPTALITGCPVTTAYTSRHSPEQRDHAYRLLDSIASIRLRHATRGAAKATVEENVRNRIGDVYP